MFDAASFGAPGQVIRFSALDDDPPVFCRSIETRGLDEDILFTGSGLDIYGSAFLSGRVSFDLDVSDSAGLTFRGEGDQELFSRAIDLPYVTISRLGVLSLMDSIDARSSVLIITDGVLRSNDHLMRWALARVKEPNLGSDPVAELDLGASDVHIYSSSNGIIMQDDERVVISNNNAHIYDHQGASYSFDGNVRGLIFTFLPNVNGGEVSHASVFNPTGRPHFRRVESFKEVTFSGPIRIDSLVLNKGSVSRFDDRAGNTLIGERLIAIGSGCSPIDMTGPRANQSGTVRFAAGAVAEMDYVRLDHIDATGPGEKNAGRNSSNVDNSSNGWDFVTNPTVQTLDQDFLGPDLNECGTIPDVLRPNTPPDFVATYRWQDGTVVPEFSPPGPGTYTLAITFGEDNCTLTDEITIRNGDLSLGADDEVVACGRSEYTLTVPDPSATGYAWSVLTGEVIGTPTNTEITVSVPATVELSQTSASCTDEMLFTITGGEVTPVDTTVRLCPGQEYVTPQMTYRPEDGDVESETYPSVYGCDSVRNITFQVGAATGAVQMVEQCANRPFNTEQESYFVTRDTVITEVYPTGSSCDSTQVYEITVIQPVTNTTVLEDYDGNELTTDQAVYTFFRGYGYRGDLSVPSDHL